MKIVIFLAFVSVTLITNTLVILFAYRAFSGMTSRATTMMADFRRNSEARELINSLNIAAEQAAKVTEATKLKIAQFDPMFGRAQENYRERLKSIDAKLEKIADNIETGATTVRNTIAKPAFTVASFAAGVTRVVEGEDVISE